MIKFKTKELQTAREEGNPTEFLLAAMDVSCDFETTTKSEYREFPHIGLLDNVTYVMVGHKPEHAWQALGNPKETTPEITIFWKLGDLTV